MEIHFTLEYWIDDGWYIGRIIEIPGIFSQGETLYELEEYIKDAYLMVIEENSKIDIKMETKTKDLIVKV